MVVFELKLLGVMTRSDGHGLWRVYNLDPTDNTEGLAGGDQEWAQCGIRAALSEATNDLVKRYLDDETHMWLSQFNVCLWLRS